MRRRGLISRQAGSNFEAGESGLKQDRRTWGIERQRLLRDRQPVIWHTIEIMEGGYLAHLRPRPHHEPPAAQRRARHASERAEFGAPVRGASELATDRRRRPRFFEPLSQEETERLLDRNNLPWHGTCFQVARIPFRPLTLPHVFPYSIFSAMVTIGCFSRT